ncbi:YtpI family protein [Paenibacillus sp. GCM10023252]|uniref:YtpI family protein n=1 Tax=Paenibacillus sp. GCM10023252 TaxID=3252649 RepID=UPI00361F5213
MMSNLISFVLAPGMIIALLFTVIHSLRARRSQDPRARGLYSARMNVSMGTMLLFMAAIQLFLSNESTLRIVMGSLFLVLGVFNIFAGLRNLSHYRTLKG